jgi:hypothetical protein
MLQKLENAYLAILRFVVIAVAGILLVAIVILGFNSLKAIQSEPELKEITPKVSVQELIKGITEFPTTPQSEHHEDAVDAGDTNKTDPNAVFYERAANVMAAFDEKYSESDRVVRVDKAEGIEITKGRAESFDDPKLVGAFAKNFAESVEKTLADPSVIKQAQTTSALAVIENVLNLFDQKFHEQIEKENAQFAAKQQQHISEKADGIQSLYIAAGAFAAFVIIVFLSIIIKIERNLRYLENRS